MITEIANALADELKKLSFADLVVGIVRPISVRTGNRDRIIPAVYDPSRGENLHKSYLAVNPDSNRKSIIYFEDQGTTLRERQGSLYVFESRMKLVCWFNYLKLEIPLYQDYKVVGAIMSHIPESLGTISDMLGVMVDFESQDPKDGSCFDKYSYDEVDAQYLLYPYDYFSLNLCAEFRLPKSCLIDIRKEEEDDDA